MSKRRRGFPSETHVKRGERIVHGDKVLGNPAPLLSGNDIQARPVQIHRAGFYCLYLRPTDSRAG